MTREYWIIPLANKNSETVLNAFMELKTHYEEHFNEVFKTITTDNGSEFADLSNLEAVSKPSYIMLIPTHHVKRELLSVIMD